MTSQDLKNSILQMAIQGKLVEQREEEGTAEELYQQIWKYSENNKKSKYELKLESMDFNIPKQWIKLELNQLFRFVDYRGRTPHKIEKGIFLITASNIRQGFMDYTRKEYISEKEYLERQNRGITKKGDLLFTTEAPMGCVALCDLEICSCGQRIITFQEYKENIVIPKLFMYFILSPSFQKQLFDNCTGTTAKGIKAEKLKHFLVPLPPLAEQKRILAKIEELQPYIEQYDKAYTRLENLNRHFPENMKKSILQWAIQGKLVEQREEEGTAEELYQQIQEEKIKLIKEGKIKKEKPLPEINKNEVPFKIPESWKWIRLGRCGSFVRGNGIKRNDIIDVGFPCVRYGQLYTTYKIKFSQAVSFISKELFEKCQKISYGDIIMALTGENNFDIALAVVYEGDDMVAIGGDMTKFTAYYTNPLYLVYVINSPYGIQYKSKLATGNIIVHISNDKLGSILIPLPPLEEQQRIVDKLEKLLSYCEKLYNTDCK